MQHTRVVVVAAAAAAVAVAVMVVEYFVDIDIGDQALRIHEEVDVVHLAGLDIADGVVAVAVAAAAAAVVGVFHVDELSFVHQYYSLPPSCSDSVDNWYHSHTVRRHLYYSHDLLVH